MTDSGRCVISLTSLASVWYGLLVSCLHGLLCWRAVACRTHLIALPWQLPVPGELAAQLVLVGLAIGLTPLFLATACVTWGRVAAAVPLGTPSWRGRPLPLVDRSSGSLCRLWRHAVPPAPLLHLLMALLLAVAGMLVEGRLIANGFMHPDNIWRTELDAVLGSKSVEFETLKSVNGTRQQLEYESLLQTPLSFSWEFVHVLIALSVLCCRYSVVFWHCRWSLALLFSVQLFSNCVHLALSLVGLSLLLKAHMYGAELLQLPLLLSLPMSAALYSLSTALVAVSGGTLYLLGFPRFFSWLQEDGDRTDGCLHRGLLPHSAALCLLLAVCVADAPLLYDTGLIYRRTRQPAPLLVLTAALLHHALWLLLWLWLALKPGWGFAVHVQAARKRLTGSASIEMITELQIPASTYCSDNQHLQELLVVSDVGTFNISDHVMAGMITSAASQADVHRLPPARPRKGVLKRPTAGQLDEQRYVQLPTRSRSEERRTRNRCRVELTPPTVEAATDSTMEHNSVWNDQRGDDGDYITLSQCEMEPAIHQPLLPSRRPRAIRPPPEQLYVCRQPRPPPLRRASSQLLLPAPSPALRRTLSFRHRPPGGRRVESRVAFDLRPTVVVGDELRPRDVAAYGCVSANQESSLGVTEKRLTNQQFRPRDFAASMRVSANQESSLGVAETRLTNQQRRRGTGKPVESAAACRLVSMHPGSRDSANYSMSVSSGSETGSTR